jgi:hypothetical protein
MALLHKAVLVPSKLELVGGWAPSQPWFDGDASVPLVTIASYRFDDPAGEVGIETLLVRAGEGPILQIPLTYRNEAVAGAEKWLIGTMDHSVLGKRWTYDAAGDPVYLEELAKATLGGGTQVNQYFEEDGKRVYRDPTAITDPASARGRRGLRPANGHLDRPAYRHHPRARFGPRLAELAPW